MKRNRKNIYIICMLNYIIFIYFTKKIKTSENESGFFSLPEKYDLREEYTECDSLRDIRDQGTCGGCWAFSTAEVISDRICISTEGDEKPFISENELITCCYNCFDQTNPEKGCGGGYRGIAFLYWIYFGLPTRSCKPFHYYKSYNSFNLKCSYYCDNYNIKPTRYYGSDFKIIKKGKNAANEIMNEIYYNGPVTANYKLYEDFSRFFWNRSSNIYEYDKKSKFLGWHAIKIIGWGVDIIKEKEVKYWICANSYGRYGGINGFFKIKRGENECEIESQIWFGYYNSDILYRSKDSIVVYEDNFFNFKNLNEDYM